jgi:hypothetical protein
VEQEWKSIASQRLAKHTFPLQQIKQNNPLLGNGSVSTFRGNGKTESHELFEVVIYEYIRVAWRLVQLWRIQSFGIHKGVQ